MKRYVRKAEFWPVYVFVDDDCHGMYDAVEIDDALAAKWERVFAEFKMAQGEIVAALDLNRDMPSQPMRAT